MDEKGWTTKKCFIISNDVIYTAYLRIATSKDRNILYTVNINKNNGILVDKERTSKLDAAVKLGTPSVKNPITPSAGSQDENLVKKQERDFAQQLKKSYDSNIDVSYITDAIYNMQDKIGIMSPMGKTVIFIKII